MINHTPDAFSAEHPLKDGVIADYDVTEAMISAFINKAAERKYPWQPKPRIVVHPAAPPPWKARRVRGHHSGGARQAYLIEEPMAAAMGADLPVTEPTGSMVVDIGGGTTEVAVISLGGIVTSSSLRLAGNRLEAIAMHLRDLLGIKIGERTAEVIKIKIGSILPFEDGRERDMIISGQDVITEQPKEVTIQSEDVRAALRPHRGDGAAHQGHLQEDQPGPGRATSSRTASCSRAAAASFGLDRYLTDKLEIPIERDGADQRTGGCLRRPRRSSRRSCGRRRSPFMAPSSNRSSRRCFPSWRSRDGVRATRASGVGGRAAQGRLRRASLEQPDESTFPACRATTRAARRGRRAPPGGGALRPIDLKEIRRRGGARPMAQPDRHHWGSERRGRPHGHGAASWAGSTPATVRLLTDPGSGAGGDHPVAAACSRAAACCTWRTVEADVVVGDRPGGQAWGRPSRAAC